MAKAVVCAVVFAVIASAQNCSGDDCFSDEQVDCVDYMQDAEDVSCSSIGSCKKGLSVYWCEDEAEAVPDEIDILDTWVSVLQEGVEEGYVDHGDGSDTVCELVRECGPFCNIPVANGGHKCQSTSGDWQDGATYTDEWAYGLACPSPE